jgi:hypothetical protein
MAGGGRRSVNQEPLPPAAVLKATALQSESREREPVATGRP